MIYTFGTAAGIINTLTSIYIYEWGMQISFLKYKKKIEWDEMLELMILQSQQTCCVESHN